MTFLWTPESCMQMGKAPIIRHVLYEFDGPKMVLAIDDRGRQLLGIAADEDEHGTIRWIFAPAPPERALSLLETRWGLRALFEGGVIDVYDIQRQWEALHSWSLPFDDVPEELLPERDAELPELRDDVRERLIAEQRRLVAQSSRAARSRIFFQGGPVRGRRGISASFAAEALSRYQDLVSRAYASRRQGNLAPTGPIPGRAESTLWLTDMPRGSVGFELVEDVESEHDSPTGLAEVVSQVATLLDAAATNDSSYAEAVAEFDPRVVIGLHAFFETLKKADASLRLEVQGRNYAFDATRVTEAVARTAYAVQGEERPVRGTLIGFLPTDYRFELSTETGQLIKGKVWRRADEDRVASFFRKPCIAHLWVVKVHRFDQVTEAFTLMGVEEPRS